MGNDHGAQSLMLGSHGDMRGPPPATMAAGGQGSRGRPSFHADYSSRERPVGPRLPRAGPPGGCSFSSTPSSSAQEGESGGARGRVQAWLCGLGHITLPAVPVAPPITQEEAPAAKSRG